MRLTFQRQYIGWGTTPNEPLEMVVRLYLDEDHAGQNKHLTLCQLESRFIAAGYDTEVGYSDGVICISKL